MSASTFKTREQDGEISSNHMEGLVTWRLQFQRGGSDKLRINTASGSTTKGRPRHGAEVPRGYHCSERCPSVENWTNFHLTLNLARHPSASPLPASQSHHLSPCSPSASPAAACDSILNLLWSRLPSWFLPPGPRSSFVCRRSHNVLDPQTTNKISCSHLSSPDT